MRWAKDAAIQKNGSVNWSHSSAMNQPVSKYSNRCCAEGLLTVSQKRRIHTFTSHLYVYAVKTERWKMTRRFCCIVVNGRVGRVSTHKEINAPIYLCYVPITRQNYHLIRKIWINAIQFISTSQIDWEFYPAHRFRRTFMRKTDKCFYFPVGICAKLCIIKMT